MLNKSKPQNNQDAFNRIWQFFVVEDHKQSKAGNFCAYRGEAKGEACAVGCMMPTKMARRADGRHAKVNDSSIFDVMEAMSSVRKWFENVDLDFLEAAQTAHDDDDFNYEKVELLKNLARDFGLTVPAATLGDLAKGRNRVLTEAK